MSLLIGIALLVIVGLTMIVYQVSIVRRLAKIDELSGRVAHLESRLETELRHVANRLTNLDTSNHLAAEIVRGVFEEKHKGKS